MITPPCFGIAGWKNSGKTSLVASLVNEITGLGLVVSTIKHAHHAFDLDTPGTDSFKHRAAGAHEVALVSSHRWAIQHEHKKEDEPSFKAILNRLSPCDLVLVEGYKREDIPKIEIIGPENSRERFWPGDQNVKAIACDTILDDCPLPIFRRDQVSVIADFILKYHGISP